MAKGLQRLVDIGSASDRTINFLLTAAEVVSEGHLVKLNKFSYPFAIRPFGMDRAMPDSHDIPHRIKQFAIFGS